MVRRLSPFVAFAALLMVCPMSGRAQTPKVPPGVWVREGYELIVASDIVRTPRLMALGEDGWLFVSQPDLGEIKALRDEDGDGRFEKVESFIRNHKTVQGLAFQDGWLYFAESGAIFKCRDTDKNGRSDEEQIVIAKGKLVDGGAHDRRALLIHKDRVYTAIGDSGNVTDEAKSPRQKIWTYALDGTGETLFCSGLHNTEKLVVRPGADELWGMDDASEWFGTSIEKKGGGKDTPISDAQPPCELNKYEPNQFYGHPFVAGNRLPRYEFIERKDLVEQAKKSVLPQWCGAARWHPVGMCFYDAEHFPNMKGNAFIAYHGSTGEGAKVGACVTLLHFENGKPWGEQVLVNFVTEKGEAKGRPVDVLVAPDGTLLISDDEGNHIYRLKHAAAAGK